MYLGKDFSIAFHNYFKYIHCWVEEMAALKDAAAAKSLQLCTTLCDPVDGSPPGSWLKTGPPLLGVWSLSHWITREVPEHLDI